MKSDTSTISVSYGNDEKTVTVRFSHRSKPVIATLLGMDKDPSGEVKRLYFDSLFHKENKSMTYYGWKPTGCISTILTRVEQP